MDPWIGGHPVVGDAVGDLIVIVDAEGGGDVEGHDGTGEVIDQLDPEVGAY